MSPLGFFFLATYFAVVLIRPQESIDALQGLPLAFLTQIAVLAFWLFGKKQFGQPQYRAILFMSLIIFISTSFISFANGWGVFNWFFSTTGMMFIVLATSVNSFDRQRKICFVYIVAAVVMSVHGIDMSLSPDRTGWTGTDMLFRPDKNDIWQVRYVGIFGDPNDMGMVLTSALCLVAYFVSTAESATKKLYYRTLGGLILYGIYLCQSRGTFLAVLVVIALYMAFRYNLVRLAVPAMIAAPLVMMVLPANLLGSSDDESSQNRIYAWYDGIQMLKSSPLVGVGTHQFEELHGLTAHNSWVLAFAEMGFLGFWCWMIIIITSLYNAQFFGFKSFEPIVEAGGELTAEEKKIQLMAKCVFFALVAALVCAFFLSRTYNIIIYILCALAMSVYNIARDNDRQLMPPDIQKKVFGIALLFPLVINVIVIIKT